MGSASAAAAAAALPPGLNPVQLGRVEAWLQAQVAAGRVAGASVGVIRRGSPAVWTASAGQARLGEEARLGPETIVRLGIEKAGDDARAHPMHPGAPAAMARPTTMVITTKMAV